MSGRLCDYDQRNGQATKEGFLPSGSTSTGYPEPRSAAAKSFGTDLPAQHLQHVRVAAAVAPSTQGWDAVPSIQRNTSAGSAWPPAVRRASTTSSGSSVSGTLRHASPSSGRSWMSHVGASSSVTHAQSHKAYVTTARPSRVGTAPDPRAAAAARNCSTAATLGSSPGGAATKGTSTNSSSRSRQPPARAIHQHVREIFEPGWSHTGQYRVCDRCEHNSGDLTVSN